MNDRPARAALYSELMWPEYNPTSEGYGTGAEKANALLDAFAAEERAAASAVPAPATDPTALRKRIAEALLDYLSRTADIRPSRTGELAFMPEITDAERMRIAEHLAAVLPAPTDQTAILHRAADHLDARAAEFTAAARKDPLAFVKGGSDARYRTADCWNSAAAELRRLAGEAQQDEAVDATPEATVNLTDGPAQCPLCPGRLTLHTPSGARAHFAAVHPEQPLTGRGGGPWPLLMPAREVRQDPAPGGKAVCIVAGCGHGDAAHGITGCRDCPRGQRAFHLFNPAPARCGQPETDEEARCVCGGRFPISHLHADEHRPVTESPSS